MQEYSSGPVHTFEHRVLDLHMPCVGIAVLNRNAGIARMVQRIVQKGILGLTLAHVPEFPG